MTAKKTRVLITEDRLVARKGLKALLACVPEIIVVGEAINGAEAVAQVEKCRPDVVLMDVQMAVMNGLEATQKIKELWPQTKIVALTLYPHYRSAAMAAGADAFLLKGSPFDRLKRAILED